MTIQDIHSNGDSMAAIVEELATLQAVIGGLTPKEDPIKKNRREAMEQLAKLGGQLDADEDVVFEGSRFVLPSATTLQGAVDFLQQKINEDEETYAFSRVFDYRPMDGARATARAIKRAFGFSLGRPIVSMFGSSPPGLIDVKVSIDETEQVPWGAMAVPGLRGVTLYLSTSTHPDFGPVFAVHVEAPRKFRFQVEGLMKLIEQELRDNSIYRGKPIDGQVAPEFLDLSGVDPADVVYSEDVMGQLEANVWSPIIHAEALALRGQPGKRAVLLSGRYGAGKTLAAFLTAQVAVQHGWTFVYCRPGKDNIDQVMQTARLYQPSVLFFEDLDTMALPGSGEDASKMLDLFDGIQAKGLKMLMVLTTNHVERLHKGMMRPGRLDAVIEIGAMDRPGVERLARRVMGDALEPDVDFDRVYAATQGFMPAFIREVFDRAVRYSITRNGGPLGQITTDDLVHAAQGLRPQLALMEGAADRSDKPAIESSIAAVVAEVMGRAKGIDDDGDEVFTLELQN